MKSINIAIACVIILIALQSVNCQTVQYYNDRLKKIDSIYTSMNNPKIPGGYAVAIIENGNVIYKKAFGLADIENNIPFTTSTVCDYASIAKQFTGFAVAKLISDGLLSLEDDIRKYLPQMHDFGTPIKIKHLLGHTSGLRDWVSLIKLSGHDFGDVITDSYLKKLIMNQKELNFKPGERHSYSNTGYFLLAHIVASITKMPFKEWAKKNIFIPMGMESTQILDDPSEIVLNKAASYEMNEAGIFKNVSNNLAATGSSSLFSSLDDMIKWVQNFTTPKVGRELFNIMLQPTIINNGDTINYNFGLEKGEWNGHKYLSHGGDWGGFLSQIHCYPQEKNAIIFVTNRNPSGVYARTKILPFLFNKVIKAEEESEELINENKPKITVGRKILDNYVGSYVYKTKDEDKVFHFADVKITHDYFVFHTSPLATNNRLYAESKAKFFTVGVDNKYEFISDEKGKTTGIKAYIEGKECFFKKTNPLIQNKEEVKDLIGSYYSEEINTTYFITIKDDRLVVQSLLNEDVPLSLIEKDIYVSNKYWFREVKFIRDAKNYITEFLIQTDNGNITKDLRFKKVSNNR